MLVRKRLNVVHKVVKCKGNRIFNLFFFKLCGKKTAGKENITKYCADDGTIKKRLFALGVRKGVGNMPDIRQ